MHEHHPKRYSARFSSAGVNFLSPCAHRYYYYYLLLLLLLIGDGYLVGILSNNIRSILYNRMKLVSLES